LIFYGKCTFFQLNYSMFVTEKEKGNLLNVESKIHTVAH
jgi:hypothetical protein